jgi:eukaryotic-like serine/threonine-protein kinase
MPQLDAGAVAQLAMKFGLLTPTQVQEAWDQLGNQAADPEPMLRHFERSGILTPWQSGKLLKGDPDGYFLGGYRILYRIAAGSFGRVYRADDPASGAVVAIKVLRRKWSDKPHNIEMFEREGKVGLALRHPNVVQILAVNRDPLTKQYYIVMEFVEGGNLRDFLAIRKRLEAAEALRIIEEATAGLAYAYSKGLTHRDIKLTNILISSQGTAKLVDFGLAAPGHPSMKDDEVEVDRTVDYAGLERATGVAEGDVRSDIYFLGCVLYELLTERSPLDMPKDPKARMRADRFVNVEPITPEECGGNAHVALLVNTMMALQPMDRYQTPSQLLDAIRDVRRELESKSGNRAGRSVYIVESDERLQDAMRRKLKELGYRVFIAVDPARALERYRQQPYDAFIADAGTTGEDSCLILDHVMAEAERLGRPAVGIVLLSEEHAPWVKHIRPRDTVAVMVRPVTLKQLYLKLEELSAAAMRPADD